MTDPWYERLKREVIDTDLCTQCGSCVGLSGGRLAFKEDRGIPLPIRTAKEGHIPEAAYRACPARRCHYPALNRFVFGTLPTNWLSGVVEQAYTAYAGNPSVRRAGASGGVISATLIHLLKTGKIKGVVCIQMGVTVPWRAEPVIARTEEEILRCAQSVYSVTPVNTILDRLEKEEGPLAYVGLPDQVASIRKLQKENHPSVRNIAWILGPYTGTQMYFEAVRSFLRSHGIRSEEEIVRLQYRAGEWPGHLEIHLRDGNILRAEKFYYNYLIPFFITGSSLQLVDFTNELTDMSVGDAWSPRFERMGGGHSVVLARTPKAVELMKEMREAEVINADEIATEEALDMHGHMLDFKKRGSFIRMSRRREKPEYGYSPASIPFSRRIVEVVITGIFTFCSTRPARWIIEHLPIGLIGPLFNAARKTWKSISKPTKRQGLRDMAFVIHEDDSGPIGHTADLR